MRRGRIFIYLALIIIIGAVGAWLYFRSRSTAKNPQASGTQATSAVTYVQVVSAAQNISPGTLITEAMLSSYSMPQSDLVQGLYTNPADVVNMYAKIAIPQGAPITASELSTIAGNVNLPGSSWSTYIPQGLTAISIPISRLSITSYGIRDGDYVDVIVTLLLVDVDPAMQSVLPNSVASLTAGANNLITIGASEVPITQGHYELDETSNGLIYVQPSEKQRPRMVTQMIMQNIQVLHVGTFPLPGEANSDLLSTESAAPAATPQPTGANETVPSTTVRPDVITVMVTPQDAVTLTYLIYSGAQLNLTLRNPNDQAAADKTDAAMLEYLLTQYDIPVPSKLPYSMNPRMDVLSQPKLPNDATPTP
jgi:pilus assembly protein CpaB